MKEATTPNWYVGLFKTPKGVIYRPLRVRVLGTLERLVNGLAKTVIEYPLHTGWQKVSRANMKRSAARSRPALRPARFAGNWAGSSKIGLRPRPLPNQASARRRSGHNARPSALNEGLCANWGLFALWCGKTGRGHK